MPNYRAKGSERMRELGRRGGLASGKTRKLKRFERIIGEYARVKFGIEPPPAMDRDAAGVYQVWEFTGRQFALEQTEEAMRPMDRRGGSHESDWRCPRCRRFNSTQSRLCRKCERFAPANGRLTRAALEVLCGEHRTQAILRKHGL